MRAGARACEREAGACDHPIQIPRPAHHHEGDAYRGIPQDISAPLTGVGPGPGALALYVTAQLPERRDIEALASRARRGPSSGIPHLAHCLHGDAHATHSLLLCFFGASLRFFGPPPRAAACSSASVSQSAATLGVVGDASGAPVSARARRRAPPRRPDRSRQPPSRSRRRRASRRHTLQHMGAAPDRGTDQGGARTRPARACRAARTWQGRHRSLWWRCRGSPPRPRSGAARGPAPTSGGSRPCRPRAARARSARCQGVGGGRRGELFRNRQEG